MSDKFTHIEIPINKFFELEKAIYDIEYSDSNAGFNDQELKVAQEELPSYQFLAVGVVDISDYYEGERNHYTKGSFNDSSHFYERQKVNRVPLLEASQVSRLKLAHLKQVIKNTKSLLREYLKGEECFSEDRVLFQTPQISRDITVPVLSIFKGVYEGGQVSFFDDDNFLMRFHYFTSSSEGHDKLPSMPIDEKFRQSLFAFNASNMGYDFKQPQEALESIRLSARCYVPPTIGPR